MLGGAALFDNSAPAVYKIQRPYTPLALNCQKGQHLPCMKTSLPIKARLSKKRLKLEKLGFSFACSGFARKPQSRTCEPREF